MARCSTRLFFFARGQPKILQPSAFASRPAAIFNPLTSQYGDGERPDNLISPIKRYSGQAASSQPSLLSTEHVHLLQ